MDNKEQTKITLVVNDENSLYSPFSPEPEFSDSVQWYIRTKLAGEDVEKSISMNVISHVTLDEDRFRAAASNWIAQERKFFRKKEKETFRMLVGSLIFATVFIILSLALEQRFNLLKYSIIPILGSLALSKAAGIMAFDMPTSRAQRWILDELEKNNVITFQYDNEKKVQVK